MVSNINSLKSELTIRTKNCIEIIDFIYESEYNFRVVTKVKDGVSEIDLIKAGQSRDLKYIIYEGHNGSSDFENIKWIKEDGSVSAIKSELLSNPFSFMRTYTLNAIKLLMDLEYLK